MLNAIEAKYSLDLGECFLVLILSDPFPEQVFRPLLSLADWKNVEYVWLSHRYDPIDLRWLGNSLSNRINEYLKESKQLVKRLRFDKLSTKLGEIDNLVLGNLLAAYMRHFANRVKAKRVYLLDDGTDTLRVNALRKCVEPDRSSIRVPLSPRAKNRLREAFLDWDVRQVNSVTFFTSYDLDLSPRDSCVKSSYAYWRQKIKSTATRTVVYFLGQPLVEDGYLRRDIYLDLLAKITAHYSGKNFLYLKHRREAETNIEAIRGRGICVGCFDLPIEVQMLTGDLPNELSSFFSSALDNCRIIFGESLKVTAFRIGQNKFNPGHEFVNEIYNYLSAHSAPHFKIIDI